jgi:hypothetical protein
MIGYDYRAPAIKILIRYGFDGLGKVRPQFAPVLCV